MDQEQQTEVAATEAETKPDAAPAEAQAIAQPDAAAEQQGEQAPEAESEEKRQSKFARRLDRHKARAVAAETEARLLREELARIKAASAPAPKADDKPRRDQFETDEDYVAALAEKTAERKAAETIEADRKAREANDKAARQREADARIAEVWTKREAEFKATTKDYEDIVTPFVEDDLQHFSEAARRSILDSDVGPALLHYLATHAEDAERIADLPAYRQAAELGKIEVRLTRPARRTSNAPEPITPVKSGASGTKDPSKMTAQEFSAWRASQGSNWITSPLRG